MILSAIWVSAICGLLKFYKCLFIYLCDYLLIIYMHTKISNEFLFISVRQLMLRLHVFDWFQK